MVRLLHAYFPRRTVILAASEGLLIVLAVLVGAFAVYGEDLDLVLFYEGGLYKILLTSSVCMLSLYYHDLYDPSTLRSEWEELARVVQSLGAASLILGVAYYIYPWLQLGRGASLIGLTFIGIASVIVRKLFLALNRSPTFAERAIILGEDPLAASVASEIQNRPELGVRLVGYVSESPSASLNGLPYWGTCQRLRQSVLDAGLKRIIVAMSERRGKLPVEDLLFLKSRGVLVQDGADVYETITGKVPVESLRLSWLVFSQGFRVSRAALIRKRVFSLLFSGLALLVGLPLMAVIAVAIRLDSPGPIVFRQQRAGKDGKLFTLFKFRTMVSGVDPDGVYLPAQERDERITRVGWWLRRTRLDEFPQLYNILRGDMYFVGPRPFVPNQEEELAQKLPLYSQRWSVRPGATGWAQIRKGYCATLEDNIERLGYDLYYIKNMSIGLDLLIVFQTTKILLTGRGAR